MIQPDVNASLGFQQMTVNITSKQYPSVTTELPVQFFGQGGQNTRDSPAVRPAELSTVVHVHL